MAHIETEYEDQLTVFVDFLGFREVAKSHDDTQRVKILELLRALSSMSGDFNVRTVDGPGNGHRQCEVKPAISTFSDNIVISYPLRQLSRDFGTEELAHDDLARELVANESMEASFMFWQLHQIVQRIAVHALKIGLLIRGGATVGKLYHREGVVFGEALVEAYEIEKNTSKNPRIVLSERIVKRWDKLQHWTIKDSDGFYCLDYFREIIFNNDPTKKPPENVQAWFRNVVEIVSWNIQKLRSAGKHCLVEKWLYFGTEFHRSLTVMGQFTQVAGLPLDDITW